MNRSALRTTTAPGSRRATPAVLFGALVALVVELVGVEIAGLATTMLGVAHLKKLSPTELRSGWGIWITGHRFVPWVAGQVAASSSGGLWLPILSAGLLGTIVGIWAWRHSGRAFGGPPAYGHGQHGTAHWRAGSDLPDGLFRWSPGGGCGAKRPGGGTWPRTGVVVGAASSQALWVSNREEHIMLVGTTGSSKSRSVFLPTLGVVAAEATHSVVVFDMKGELYAHSAEAFSSAGYHVRQFNLRAPRAGGERSRWNPVAAVTQALRADDAGRATQVAWAIAHALAFRSGDKAAAEMWPATSEATIASLILALAAGTPLGASKRLEDLVALNPRLVNWRWPHAAEQHLGSVYRCLVNPGPGATHLEDWVTRLLPPDHPAVDAWAAMAASAASERTRASILTTAAADMRLLAEPDIRWLLGAQGEALEQVGTEKTALFVIVPDDDSTRYPLASLFVQQLMSALTRLADGTPGGRLPVPTLFLLDEFGNFPPIPHFLQFLTAARSRGMRALIALQSFAQLTQQYGPEAQKIIMDNLGTWVYLLTSSPEMAQYLSERCGTYTTLGEGRNVALSSWSTTPVPHSTESESLVARPLLTPDEIMRWPARQSLVLQQRKPPARLSLPDLSELHSLLPSVQQRTSEVQTPKDPTPLTPTWWPYKEESEAPSTSAGAGASGGHGNDTRLEDEADDAADTEGADTKEADTTDRRTPIGGPPPGTVVPITETTSAIVCDAMAREAAAARAMGLIEEDDKRHEEVGTDVEHGDPASTDSGARATDARRDHEHDEHEEEP